MPNQIKGTWMMGLKCDNTEVLQQFKDKLINGLSIEGQLDTVDDNESPISKFNKHFMKKTPLEFAKHLANVIMAAVATEEDPKAEDAEGVEGSPAEEAKETPEEEKVEDPTGDESKNVDSELATALATIDELQKKVADQEAELATYKNDATLMSSQLEEVKTAFESYKAVKMSSQKLGDLPKEKVVLTPAEEKQAKFLADVQSRL